MDLDEVWRHIDEQRGVFCEIAADLSDVQLATQSLCAGWTTRDVVAHLALAHTGPVDVAVGLLRARGSFNAMIHDTAVRRAHSSTVTEDVARVRSFVGSRRKAPVVSPLEPLTDALVHTQDLARPLGIEVSMPTDAALTAAHRVWTMGFPFDAQKRFRGRRLVATDVDWAVGEPDGEVTEAPISELLMLVSGRPAR